jgi:hypothetical protein
MDENNSMKPTRIIFWTWLFWVLIVLGFQAWVAARVELTFPDRAQEWTYRFTEPGYQQGHVYLLEPFMNRQVAWDSEYYLSIAVAGYDDPRSPHLTHTGVIVPPGQPPVSNSISVNYAFFPLYPWLIRILAFPLRILGMNAIATAALAGVIVSALGALLGMLALNDFTRTTFGEEGALRAAFYLIIFPTAFFLVQVYTEGLFVGMAFASLAMLKRGNWWSAALFGIGATLTRAVGVALVIPMLIAWIRTGEWRQILHQPLEFRPLVRLLLAMAPLLAFVVWKFSPLGRGFDTVESNYFRRGFLALGDSYSAWADAFSTMVQGTNPQHTAYYFTEFLGFAIAIAACIACLRLDPELAWFSIAVVLISWGSVTPQGIHRYILGAPAVFYVLAHWGRNPIFDRAWTILSILLMGALAMLFAFNMWVA